MPEPNTKVEEKPVQSKPAPKEGEKKDATLDKIVAKIGDAENVLVALSDNPTVDEMAAAIGLTMVLDSIGKHATAIYSGKTPNVLEFLNPQATFETNTNSLQDFIIALNKEKADHLRYKVDGDFVKVYITPYRTTISEDDLEFSRGDFNVDLVIALNVAAATDLDGALKEHGRIMHDASAINITTGEAGKFGEVEWTNPEASSISEMVTNLATRLQKDLDQASATALLTGLVAATDRFSNEQTTPAAMVLAATLMKAGADQQLVAANVSGGVGAGGEEAAEESSDEPAGEIKVPKKEEDKSVLDVRRSEPAKEEQPEEAKEEPKEEVKAEEAKVEETPAEEKPAEEPATLPTITPLESGASQPATVGNVIAGVEIGPTGGATNGADGASAGNLADSMVAQITGAQETKDYGKMIDEALSEPLPGEGGIQVGANGPSGMIENTQDVEAVSGGEGQVGQEPAAGSVSVNNPAVGAAPIVSNTPAVNNIPPMTFSGEYVSQQPEKVLNPANAQEIFKPLGDLSKELENMAVEQGGQVEQGMSPEANMGAPETGQGMGMEPVPVPSGLPMPDQEILPPPPTPPVDFGNMNAENSMPAPMPEMPQVQFGNVPEAQSPEQAPPENNSGMPGAFQIPNM